MIVLQFSGGKDSLACLELLRPKWDQLTVVWVNRGAAFPETKEQMEQVRQQVPHFREIASRQTIRQDGFPADVVPVSRSSFGQLMAPSTAPRFQSRYTCCANALWFPMAQAMRELGATVVLRGQKAIDSPRAPYQPGEIVEGIRYEFPLWDWSDLQVYEYLEEHDIPLPANYRHMKIGLDCWNCTAYLTESAGNLHYLREHHPDKHAFVMSRLKELQQALDQETQPLRAILENV